MGIMGNTEHLPLFAGLAVVAAMGRLYLSRNDNTVPATASTFKTFQRNFLAVFLTMAAADWLQGPYIYALYEEYGYTMTEIGTLFVIGFGSSGVMGAFVGSCADSWGRKKMALAFGVLYSISCLTKHVNDFWVLAFGRLVGGAATSILFSVFDAWMVHEHHHRQYDASWVGQTFATAAFGNGVVAILTSLVASAAATHYGKVAPFDIAVLCLIAGSVLVALTWNENYGTTLHTESTFESLKEAAFVCITNPAVIYCGLIQSVFEGSMYIFVLMWTPTLPHNINHGIIFGCFMVGIMIGSEIFELARQRSIELITIVMGIFMTTLPLFMVPMVVDGEFPWVILGSFIGYEVAVGVYFSAFYTLRSEVVPDKGRATILNFYRIPLNLVVLVVCLYAGTWSRQTLFGICAAFQALGLVFTVLLRANRVPSVTVKNTTPPVLSRSISAGVDESELELKSLQEHSATATTEARFEVSMR